MFFKGGTLFMAPGTNSNNSSIYFKLLSTKPIFERGSLKISPVSLKIQ